MSTNKSFEDLVKSEIQDKDPMLSKIPNPWGEGHRELIELILIQSQDGKIGYGIDDRYDISEDVKEKIAILFQKYYGNLI